jgi:hypothetical protein
LRRTLIPQEEWRAKKALLGEKKPLPGYQA